MSLLCEVISIRENEEATEGERDYNQGSGLDSGSRREGGGIGGEEEGRYLRQARRGKEKEGRRKKE